MLPEFTASILELKDGELRIAFLNGRILLVDLRTYPFQLFHNFTGILRRSAGNEDMYVVTSNLTPNYFNLEFGQNVSSPGCTWVCYYPFAIFWNPNQTHLHIPFCLGYKLIKWHGDNINLSSPEGEELPPFSKETLIDNYDSRIAL